MIGKSDQSEREWRNDDVIFWEGNMIRIGVIDQTRGK